MQRPFLHVLASLALLGGLIGLIAACSSAKNDPPLDNGVNDVHQACELRTTWTNSGGLQCSQCIAAAPLPDCKCEAFKDYAALCLAQGDARRADPQCTPALDDCVNVCDKADCNCIDACYAMAPSCKQHDAARDGCVADVCNQYCK